VVNTQYFDPASPDPIRDDIRRAANDQFPSAEHAAGSAYMRVVAKSGHCFDNLYDHPVRRGGTLSS
jgi:hypothetical protein